MLILCTWWCLSLVYQVKDCVPMMFSFLVKKKKQKDLANFIIVNLANCLIGKFVMKSTLLQRIQNLRNKQSNFELWIGTMFSFLAYRFPFFGCGWISFISVFRGSFVSFVPLILLFCTFDRVYKTKVWPRGINMD